MDKLIKSKKIENNTKYKVLVNYLKDLIDVEEGYTTIITAKDIRRILKSLEEVE